VKGNKNGEVSSRRRYNSSYRNKYSKDKSKQDEAKNSINDITLKKKNEINI